MNTKKEYPTQKEADEENEINTLWQSQHKKHEWKSQTKCKPSQQMLDRQ
jgi:hypothetical protein